MSRKKLKIPEKFIIGISDRIKKIRGELSQREFAKILGVEQGTISRYESGRIPDSETLQKIAAYGKVSVENLLFGDKSLVLSDARDLLGKEFLGPDTPGEIKDILIKRSHETMLWLREQLLLADTEIKHLRQELESCQGAPCDSASRFLEEMEKDTGVSLTPDTRQSLLKMLGKVIEETLEEKREAVRKLIISFWGGKAKPE